MAVYDDHDPSDTITKYKFLIFDYISKTILNLSFGLDKFKIFYYDILTFMSYKIDTRYYMSYVYKLDNITNTTMLQYQINIQEVTSTFAEDPFTLDLLPFYPDMDYIVKNKIMAQSCFISKLHSKFICLVHSNVASELLMWNFPALDKDDRYTISTDCIKMNLVSILVKSTDKLYFSCQEKVNQKGTIMSVSLADLTQSQIILRSEMSPHYLSITTNFDETIMSVSEYNSG